MNRARTGSLGKALLASAAGVALAGGLMTPAVANPSPSGNLPEAAGVKSAALPTSTAPAESKISPRLADAQGEIAVYVQFTGSGAFAATQPDRVMRGLQEPLDRTAQVQSLRNTIDSAAEAAAAAADAETLYTTTNTLPGVALQGDAEALRALAEQANVVSIKPIVPKTIENRGADADVRALNSWVNTGETGEGVRIAVIDSGVDYTHAAMGGPGTQEAFDEARAMTELPAPDSGLYDPKKFVGGWDLVGDAYNASPTSPNYSPIPQPDANPMDCGGHGAHVTGTAAGYGVGEDGKTFRGDYGSLTKESLSKMKIGPGTAPKAEVLAFRVFGCDGSTNVVGEALDRALDPNLDGDFSDRADIINLSLGSTFAAIDDPENAIIDQLTQRNILSVISSGNSGDVYDVGGSPANARSSLAVANSIGSTVSIDRVDYDAGGGDYGQVGGQYSANFDYFNPDVTREQLRGSVVVAPESNKFGCAAFPAGSLEGKWVWMRWVDDPAAPLPCGSAARFNNAQAAGATGVVLDSPVDVFDGGIAGNATIPGVQLTKSAAEKLQAAAQAGTLQIQLDPDYVGALSVETGKLDQLNPSSSRNAHGSQGILKPDVAAPGTQISSIAVGGGNRPSVLTGTSMSAPNVSGIAALVRGKYPRLTATAVKALVMNTANHDLKTTSGAVYGPNRVGTGRVDALDALTSDAYAWATDDVLGTSVNFGVVEVADQPITASKSVSVRNASAQARTYAVGYAPSSQVPGVTYTHPASVTIPANSTATVPVTMTIANPAAVQKSRDPSLTPVQSGIQRQFIAEAAGRLTLNADGLPQLRLPVHSTVKLSSAISAGPVQFGTQNNTLVRLSGRGNPEASGFKAKVAGFQLGASSPKMPASPLPQRETVDLQYVGANTSVPAVIAAGRDPQSALLNFGITTWANLPILGGNNEFDVEIDTNNDGRADFLTRLTRVSGVDLPVAATFAVVDGETSEEPLETLPVNAAQGNIDTNTMDTNAFTMPVPAALLGVDLTQSAPVQYRVSSYNYYQSEPVDSTDWISWNATQPAFASGNSDGDVIFDGVPDTGLPAQRAGSGSAQALFLHLHNSTGNLSGNGPQASGNKAQVVPVQASQAAIESASTVTTIAPDGTLFAYPAAGNGKLGERKRIGTGWNNATSVSVVDWNNDGVLDIVSTWRSGNLAVSLGTAERTFAPATVLARNWNTPVVATQWARGAQPGLLSIAGNGQLQYWGQQNGRLVNPVNIGAGWSGFEITALDWDKDGSMDLIARVPNGDVRVYRSAGNGGFVSEPRPVVGRGWGIFSSIVARPGVSSEGSQSVLAIDREGKLRNYPVTNRAFGPMSVTGTGWNGYRLAK